MTWRHEKDILPRHGLVPGASIADICCGIGDFAGTYDVVDAATTVQASSTESDGGSDKFFFVFISMEA